jgi:hypothetical protein
MNIQIRTPCVGISTTAVLVLAPTQSRRLLAGVNINYQVYIPAALTQSPVIASAVAAKSSGGSWKASAMSSTACILLAALTFLYIV